MKLEQLVEIKKDHWNVSDVYPTEKQNHAASKIYRDLDIVKHNSDSDEIIELVDWIQSDLLTGADYYTIHDGLIKLRKATPEVFYNFLDDCEKWAQML